jgi:hypothetical protein
MRSLRVPGVATGNDMLPGMKICRMWGALVLFVSLAVLPLDARVIRVEIASRTDVLSGKVFGDAGAYERVTGRVYFSLAIVNPHNIRIVDFANAVNLKNGEVEFSADFVAVRPKDANKGNGSMLLEVPNRGRSRIIALVDEWETSVGKNTDEVGCASREGCAKR